jgi:hypothetical protein
MKVCSVQLPEEARELDKELRAVTKEKNEAVRGQDFEKVSLLVHVFLPSKYCRGCCIVLFVDWKSRTFTE